MESADFCLHAYYESVLEASLRHPEVGAEMFDGTVAEVALRLFSHTPSYVALPGGSVMLDRGKE